MTIKQYHDICSYLNSLIIGTKYYGNVYTVGGCVRDELMGNEIKDIDMVVSWPNGGVKFAEWLYDNAYLSHEPILYPTYGTSMFRLKEYPDVELEAVQTRKEQYKDRNSRNPETCYGTLMEDCMRRDLTINSLYYNITTGDVLDLTGNGKADIENHVIRVTSDPDIVYSDDALRILRCIRFSSRFGWEISKDTFDGMKRNVDRLSIITKERVQDEFNKMLACNNPVMALRMIKVIGAMKYIIPELEETYDMEQNKYHFGTVWEHTLCTVDNVENDLVLRMSALLHDIGKINTRTFGEDGNVHFYGHELESARLCDTILRRLKYSNDFIRKVQKLVKNHMRTKNWGNDCKTMKDKSLRKFQYEMGADVDDCLVLIHADNMSHANEYCMPDQVENIRKRLHELELESTSMIGYKLPVDGNDVMNVLGIGPCKEVKECLDWLMKFAYMTPKITREKMMLNIKQFRNAEKSN